MSSLNNRQVLFKIDTGADVTAIPEAIYDKSKYGPLLQSNRILKGLSDQKLNVKGYIEATLGKDQDKMEERVFIVKGLQKALVGRPVI